MTDLKIGDRFRRIQDNPIGRENHRLGYIGRVIDIEVDPWGDVFIVDEDRQVHAKGRIERLNDKEKKDGDE